MTTTLLRAMAVAIAIAGAIDPAVNARRGGLPAIDIRLGSAVSGTDRAGAARLAVAEALDGAALVSASVRPDGIVLVEPGPADLERAPDGVPISIVTAPEAGPRLVRVWTPPVVAPGQAAEVRAAVAAPPSGGRVRVTLEQNGVELAAAIVDASAATRPPAASLTYAPPTAGVHHLRLVARREGQDDPAHAVDVPLVVTARTLRLLVFESRPGWTATFVRRALEADGLFAVDALARTSRGIDVRTGDAPARLSAGVLEPYDAAIVGGPEAMTDSDVQALDGFVRRRGGTVVLLPDRRPTGPYLRLVPSSGFDERLLDPPVALDTGSMPGLTAGEFALPRGAADAGLPLASLRQGPEVGPAIVSWPAGHGRVVFAGALDAWRHRADDNGAFARFWTTAMAGLALASPPPVALSLDPPLSAPGDRVRVRARVRETEMGSVAGRVEVPAMACTLVDGDGVQQVVRLWPGAEDGAFEGAFDAPAAGAYTVRARAGQASAAALLVVQEGIRRPPEMDGLMQDLARASGGVVADPSQLATLRAHVEGLSGAATPVTARPMRSGWWMVPFAAALAAEWALRRRRGKR